MANALNGLQSAPFAGLGTASYQVVSGGLYTMQFRSFLPYLAPGSPAVSSQPVAEVQTVGTVADVAGSLNSKYFTFFDAGNAHGYYVWYNINSAGVDPAVAGLTGIQVAGVTGATANALATSTRAAINAISGISVVASGATNNVIISANFPGTMTAAADGTAATGFSFAVNTAGSWGVPAVSGLVVTLKQNSTVLQVKANPSPTQPTLSGQSIINCSANDVLSFVFSSLSPVDNVQNAVKSIINIFSGE